MKECENALLRPLALRTWIYIAKRDLLTAKIEKAETEEERAQLVAEREKLDREFRGTIETR